MKTRVTFASVALLGALASGCVDNRASIQVQYICVPTAECSFPTGCDTQYSGPVLYDPTVSTAGGAGVFLNVKNQLPKNDNLDVGQLNTNDAHVDEVSVELEGATVGSYTTGTNAFVPAAGAGAAAVPIALTDVNGEVLARVKLGGYYDNGSRFETGEFTVTIVVADGSAPAKCGTNPTCPSGFEGQEPLTCGTAAP